MLVMLSLKSMRAKTSSRIRDYARQQFLEPARKRGDAIVRIVAGEVHKGLHLDNRVPQVCAALRSGTFLRENHLTLERMDGPPSGMSTTVTFTYRLLEGNRSDASAPGLDRIWGIGKDVFQSLGGGEAFIDSGRDQFYGRGESS